MIAHKGDIHHIFPKDYLKKNGLKKSQYNQIANYVYMQTEINIQVGNKAPNIYLSSFKNNGNGNIKKYGGISEYSDLTKNFDENSIPEELIDMKIDDYSEFLESRRSLMAKKIKKYYSSL